jgi:hypothetical protein
MPFFIASNRKCNEPWVTLVSPQGGRQGRLEKVVLMSICAQKLCQDMIVT